MTNEELEALCQRFADDGERQSAEEAIAALRAENERLTSVLRRARGCIEWYIESDGMHYGKPWLSAAGTPIASLARPILGAIDAAMSKQDDKEPT